MSVIELFDLEKLINNFFNKNTIPEELKVIFRYYFNSKLIYLKKLLKEDDAVEYINLEIDYLNDLHFKFEKLSKYHSLYFHYSKERNTFYYYICDHYNDYFFRQVNKSNIKQYLNDEFYILVYNELLNLRCNSELISIFNEIEACNIYSLSNKKYKYIVDKDNKKYILCRHASLFNYEILSYVELIFKFVNKSLFYEKTLKDEHIKKIVDTTIMISDELRGVLLFNGGSSYDLIMKYLMHIKYRYNEDNKLRYHSDLSNILKLNFASKVGKINDYILN